MIITEEKYNSHERVVKKFIDNNCIVRGAMPGKTPGSTYTWMFYLRNGLFNPTFLQYVSEMMLYKLHKELGNYRFQVCGAETAGTPLAAAIPLVAKSYGVSMSGFVTRKDQKTYGLKNWHEGTAHQDVPYVLVDDLCNSSTSLNHANYICDKFLKLQSAGVAIVIVNKVNKDVHSVERTSTDMYLPKDIKVLSLFDLDSFNLTGPSH